MEKSDAGPIRTSFIGEEIVTFTGELLEAGDMVMEEGLGIAEEGEPNRVQRT